MDAIDLVQLPRMTAVGALAFADQLVSCATPHKKVLPKTSAAALGELSAAQSVLASALRGRLEPQGAADLPALDRGLDSAWSALHDFGVAFSKLPGGGPLVDAANLIQSALFADGLKFIQLAYPLEWAESQVRLSHMETSEMAAALTTLGAGTFVTAIRTAHVAYGKALGMGAARTLPASPNVRPAYEAVLYAIRLYVVKVCALIETDRPETKALVDALLVPFTTWNVRTGKKTGPADDGSPDPSPAPPAAQPAAASPAQPAAPSPQPV